MEIKGNLQDGLLPFSYRIAVLFPLLKCDILFKKEDFDDTY